VASLRQVKKVARKKFLLKKHPTGIADSLKKTNSKAQPKPVKERTTDKVVAPAPAAGSYMLAMQKAYGKRVDSIDKKLGLNFALAKQPRVSTGMLAVDLMLGNGFVPGMSVFVGAEQSAKSTASMTTLRSSLGSNIPLRKYFDAEGAIDRRYTGNILGTDSFTDVFGARNKSGTWVTQPKCLYSDSNVIETVFKSMIRSTLMMPDKVYHEGNEQWYLVFDRTTEQKNLLKELMASGAIKEHDKSLFSSTGRYWCSVGDDDAPQAIFFVDSIPALVAERVDEEEQKGNDKGQGIASEARFLGPYLKQIRGKLRPKGIVLLCVNQLRDRPMAGPGQLPYYETGGNVLKFTSDSRSMWTSCVPREGFPRWKDNGGLCMEDSVEFEGGMDLYAFKSVKNVKNKIGPPFRKCYTRVWIKDGGNEPRGIDPVYDTFQFLDTLGAIEGFTPSTISGDKEFHICLKPVESVKWTWSMFKAMIIGQYDHDRRMLKIANDMGAPARFDLRGYCRKLLASGKSEDMLASYLREREKKGANDIDIEADAEDE
jgi:RecA/RadA recombinase